MAGLVLTVSWTQISERRQNKRRFYHMALGKQRVENISSSVFRFRKIFLEFLSVSLSIILRMVLYPNNIKIVGH